MAKFSSTQAPVTNPQANQRLKDTQALRMRASVGAAKPGQAVTQAAQQTGAAITQQTGQRALQQQQQQQQLAGQQAQTQIRQQGLGQQQQTFDRQRQLATMTNQLDAKLNQFNEQAADIEQKQRLDFINNQAQGKFLNEQQLADWTVANAKDEQEFKDRIQDIEQAHKKKATMMNYAFAKKMQSLQQEIAWEKGERRQQLRKELAEIKHRFAQERERRAAEAANRKAMRGAAGSILGTTAMIALAPVTGGASLKFIPVAASTGKAAGEAT